MNTFEDDSEGWSLFQRYWKFLALLNTPNIKQSNDLTATMRGTLL